MYRVAFRLCGNRASAEELVQETYLQAWKGLKKLRDSTKIRAWIFSIMHRQVTKMRMPWDEAAALSPDQLQAIAATPPPTDDPREEILRDALTRLDNDHRMPLLLAVMEEMTAEEVAEILNIPRGTVLSRLHRAREKIRNMVCLSEAEIQIVSTRNPRSEPFVTKPLKPTDSEH